MMKHFLLRSAIFLLFLLVCAAALELFVRSLPNSYKLKNEWMENNSNSVECIVLGNSHALFSFRPDSMGNNIFNLANVSQTLDYDCELLKHYAPRCRNLKSVILTVDNSNLFDASLDEMGPHRAAFYKIYMGIDRHSVFSRYGLELMNAATVQAKLQKHFSGNDLEVDSLGWGFTYKDNLRDSENLSIEQVKSRIEGHTCTNWSNAMSNQKSVMAIARYCKENGIRLVLIETPTSRAYNRLIPKRQLDFISQTLSLCQEKYGAITLDLHDDERFGDNDFFDADHITDLAATRLSRIAASVLADK